MARFDNAKTYTASSNVPRYRVVQRVAGTHAVSLATAADQFLHGVSAEPADVTSGQRIDVQTSGFVEVEAGAAIALGAYLTADAQGRVVTATSADEIIGRANDTASQAGDVIEIEITKGVL